MSVCGMKQLGAAIWVRLFGLGYFGAGCFGAIGHFTEDILLNSGSIVVDKFIF